MDFYLLPVETLEELDKFQLNHYRKICSAVCSLEPNTNGYCADLIDATGKVDKAIGFFPPGEAKANLAILKEALQRELEDVAIKDFARPVCRSYIVKIIKGHIQDSRKSRRNMLEAGYRAEFI